MKSPSQVDIEEQLSIAYVHAVCARAALSWQCKPRLADNNGIDGEITGWPPLGKNDGYLKQADLHVQLKATKQQVKQSATHFSYPMKSVAQYDDLRETNLGTAKILVVLLLPKNSDEWLSHTHEQLLLKKCAYWVSLRGAAPSTNTSGQTVYIPKSQPFNVEEVRELASRLTHRNFPNYQLP